MSHQPGFFDFDEQLAKYNAHNNTLQLLDEIIDYEAFRPILNRVRCKQDRKSNAGRKPYDVVLMFKMLILKSLYNLSFEQVELQVRDRISFMAFLGLRLGDTVPDEKTLWLFHDELARRGLVKELFEIFNGALTLSGFSAREGNMIDASIVPAPIQRNRVEENEQIKQGETPEFFKDNPHKARQKDTDARWTMRRNKSHFGYKNHIAVDAEHKLIRKYKVTDAATHDSQMLHELLDDNNESPAVYADSAYASKDSEAMLETMCYEDRVCRKGARYKKLTKDDIDLSRHNGGHSMIRIQAKTIGGQFWEPKTKVNRAVPISSALRKYLDQYTPRELDIGWFFPSPQGTWWDTDNFARKLRNANNQAGLKWSCLDSPAITAILLDLTLHRKEFPCIKLVI